MQTKEKLRFPSIFYRYEKILMGLLIPTCLVYLSYCYKDKFYKDFLIFII